MPDVTTTLRRQCAYNTSSDSYSNWSAADKLHSMVGSFAEPYDQFLGDGGWTEEEKPEVDYRLRQVSDTKVIRSMVEDAAAEAVRNARMAGATWDEIGKALGISRQAAQQRFGGAR